MSRQKRHRRVVAAAPRASAVVALDLAPDPSDGLALAALQDGTVRLLDVPSPTDVATLGAKSEKTGALAFARFRPRAPEVFVSRAPGELEGWSYERIR